MPTPSLFCFGLGYTGIRLAYLAMTRGWRVAGTCRDPEKAGALRSLGIRAIPFADGRPGQELKDALFQTTHLLESVPPGEDGDPVLGCYARQLETLSGSLKWIGYLSTTGVYGDCGGDWIDESRTPNPATRENRRRLDAESAWLDLGARMDTPTQVFRLPGIYGPEGRSVIDALESGRARRILKPGQVFNRIHVYDLVEVLMASMERPDAGRVYNVADDEPAPADEVLSYAAALLDLEPPPTEPFEQADLSPFARHFYNECKRVSNDRIKRELEVQLRYPTYREGLRAIARSRLDPRA
ncbi:SDR family oxidoreductase [Imhoffiella purpurea]|uniref:Nucleoside-diphosphate-sugar epimerase n=1 Tax=Imhoffiella purpurea TaxID=1249627 RepID=W9W1H6_9GAMM|nr:SDR family oxidoreductase [Imhoffiella purpurea]EXJ16455.1 Nucleoside-diphosphate-sugar epimerase [Imhoffiella purpurea]